MTIEAIPLPPLDVLRATFTIGGPTGLLRKGRPAGGPRCPRGYHRVKHKGTAYQSHRIILSLKLGRLLETDEEVDHIDRNPRNNHPDNLRPADRSLNRRNVRAWGVTRWRKGWRASYCGEWLGDYPCFAHALQARRVGVGA